MSADPGRARYSRRRGQGDWKAIPLASTHELTWCTPESVQEAEGITHDLHVPEHVSSSLRNVWAPEAFAAGGRKDPDAIYREALRGDPALRSGFVPPVRSTVARPRLSEADKARILGRSDLKLAELKKSGRMLLKELVGGNPHGSQVSSLDHNTTGIWVNPAPQVRTGQTPRHHPRTSDEVGSGAIGRVVERTATTDRALKRWLNSGVVASSLASRGAGGGGSAMGSTALGTTVTASASASVWEAFENDDASTVAGTMSGAQMAASPGGGSIHQAQWERGGADAIDDEDAYAMASLASLASLESYTPQDSLDEFRRQRKRASWSTHGGSIAGTSVVDTGADSDAGHFSVKPAPHEPAAPVPHPAGYGSIHGTRVTPLRQHTAFVLADLSSRGTPY